VTGARGDAAATRRAILAAARELFAARGVAGVSVRDIAARAGVNHALVHRYFGAKDDMVAAILRAEAETMSSGLGPGAEAPESLEALRSILDRALTDGRTSLLLMLRAELDGLAPERLRDDAVLRPIAALSGWLEANQAGGAGLEPRALAMLLAAAVLGFAGAQPLLSAGAGYRDEDPDEVRRRVVDSLVGVAAVAAGREPPPRPPETDRPHETEETHP
jgi:AcrR family transcriptional regulator